MVKQTTWIWHKPKPGPDYWNWRCLWCSQPVSKHAPWWRLFWRQHVTFGKVMRPIRWMKFTWKTRHWDQSHFPGCPVRYGTGTECIDPEILCADAKKKES